MSQRVPQVLIQGRVREQIVDFPVPQINAKVAEMSQRVPQELIHVLLVSSVVWPL